ncbi:MAG: class I SAM-dependent rRNA methyltransferase [Planctomycetia bacterium]|nr:class I SAM-dependent rRNA methyltransferase [Planctomycetia bacterium]
METSLTAPTCSAAARVVLKPRKALPFYGRHPWVLASAVDRVEPTSIESEHLLDLDGQLVELVNDKRKFIAHGLFNSHSRIRVRLYSWSADEHIEEAFFRRKIEAAINLRCQIGYEPGEKGTGVISRNSESILEDSSRESTPDPLCRSTSATRLVFSEADGVSGLVVDRYGDYLVVQPTALGIAQRLGSIVGILQDLLQPRAIVLKLDKAMTQLEGMSILRADEPHPGPVPKSDAAAARQRTDDAASIPFADGHVWGDLPEGPALIREHGLAYEVDLRTGQKTGLYLDQRENRLAAAKYLRGRRVLDLFCYTGGFALTAAKLGGAAEVLGIDGSKTAIARARRNAEINALQNVQFECGDGFQTLDKLIADGEKFDAVILDPPKFARGRGGANAALMAYHRLNRAAVELLQRDGILLSCSCTGGVSREDFLLMLSGVAQKSRRDIRVLEQRGAAPDHPVSATCLETEYLKCMICEVQ